MNKVHGRITVRMMEQIEQMMDAHETKFIADVMNLSISGVCNYKNILRQLHSGEAITMNPRRYNPEVVRAYCEKHGIEFKTEEPPAEPVQTQIDLAPQAEPVTAQDAMDRMMQAFLDLAEQAEAFAAKMRAYQNA